LHQVKSFPVNEQFVEDLDQQIKVIEASIKQEEQKHEFIKQRPQHSSRKHKSRNDLTGSGADSIGQIHTHREAPYHGSQSFMIDNDLNSKSLLDFRTKFNQPNQRLSTNQTLPSNINKKRPQSSQIKRSQITHKALNKPVIDGDIMVKITIKINKDSNIIANVYKGDTAYSVAERCISQHLNKMKVKL
jgi:hypothetical protein